MFPDPCSSQRSPLVLRTENLFHAGLQRTETVRLKPGPNGDNDVTVGWKHISVEPEGFPDQPFNPVSAHSIADLFLHTYSQTVETYAIGQDNDIVSIPSQPMPKLIDALKLPCLCEQMCFRKSMPAQLRFRIKQLIAYGPWLFSA
ncbi:hypothetical protein [Desulfobulbus alkaliphilus]|uniref:hypothetical protein n=1 Tax=Desulfobulbus alkaliphilus TaxID=869814 RepID=UPI003FCD4851